MSSIQCFMVDVAKNSDGLACSFECAKKTGATMLSGARVHVAGIPGKCTLTQHQASAPEEIWFIYHKLAARAKLPSHSRPVFSH
eukprot:1160125-Pelagomonas_calceolata.AAC.16